MAALAGVALLYWFPVRRWCLHWGATEAEVAQPMSGDVVVPNPNYETTLALTINAPPAAVWPWLLQLGYQRGGLYSYDWLDRLFGFLDRPSANRILPEFQNLNAGDVIPIGRGGGFPVKTVEPLRSLLLAGSSGGTDWMWQLTLAPIDDAATRLISRNRGRLPRTLASVLFMAALEPAAFLMTRRMLIGIKSRAEKADPLLDRFMPAYDVDEHHSIRINAEPEVVLATAARMDLGQSPLIRAIFKMRAWVMGSRQAPLSPKNGLVEDMKRIGWGVLAEVPGHELVMGAVTQPWKADVVFRPLPPDQFASFSAPGFVKIAWTLRADPAVGRQSIFRTETRVWPTDAVARSKFRRYWAFVAPGIIAIRWLLLSPLKTEAERRTPQPS
jgi:hypothetical protein